MKKTQSKAGFVRSLPATLSAVEVIAEGKKAGVKLTKNYVYRIKTLINAHAKAEKAPATGPAKAPSPSAKPAQSKADFVRSRSHLSPKEIVEDAHAAGIELDVQYVYNVRGSRARAKVTKQAARTVRQASAAPTPIARSSKAEDLLKALGAELGLGRAVEILLAERARVHSVLRG